MGLSNEIEAPHVDGVRGFSFLSQALRLDADAVNEFAFPRAAISQPRMVMISAGVKPN